MNASTSPEGSGTRFGQAQTPWIAVKMSLMATLSESSNQLSVISYQ
jgi:hypothetical protein